MAKIIGYGGDGHLAWIGIDGVCGSDRPPRVSRGRLCFAPAGTPVPTRTAEAVLVARAPSPMIYIIPAATVGLCSSAILFRQNF